MREDFHVRAYRGDVGGGGRNVSFSENFKCVKNEWSALFWKTSTLKIQKYLTNVPKTFTKTSVKKSINGERLQNFKV